MSVAWWVLLLNDVVLVVIGGLFGAWLERRA